MSQDTNFAPLTGGSAIAVAVESATTLHETNDANIGSYRGSIIHLFISNSNAASRTVTLASGSWSQVLGLPANDAIQLDFWMDEGNTLTAQASDTDVQVFGHERRVT